MLRREVGAPILPRLSLLERVVVAIGVLTVALAIAGGTMESVRVDEVRDVEPCTGHIGVLSYSEPAPFRATNIQDGDRGDITVDGSGATLTIDAVTIGRITPWHGQAVTLSPDTISAPRIRARNASDERPAR